MSLVGWVGFDAVFLLFHHVCNYMYTCSYSAGKGSVIDAVLIRYSQGCGIKLVVLRNLPIDVVAVLVYFRQFGTKSTPLSGTVFL